MKIKMETPKWSRPQLVKLGKPGDVALTGGTNRQVNQGGPNTLS